VARRSGGRGRGSGREGQSEGIGALCMHALMGTCTHAIGGCQHVCVYTHTHTHTHTQHTHTHKHRWVTSEDFGFVGACPSNAGTSFVCQVTILLPTAGKDSSLILGDASGGREKGREGGREKRAVDYMHARARAHKPVLACATAGLLIITTAPSLALTYARDRCREPPESQAGKGQDKAGARRRKAKDR
jgi:hypothetical protein